MIGLTAKSVKEQFNISLERMKQKSIDLLYLHVPDWNTPILETLTAINDLYKEGKFKRFGLSNYASYQVMEIYYLCKEKAFVLPTVYQGMYNGITRDVETELFGCLRYLGIKFYSYNILAGGILSGKHKYEDYDNKSIKKGRFYGDSPWAQFSIYL